MDNAPELPATPRPAPVETALDYEHLPASGVRGVRAVPVAYAEQRALPRFRWSAVVAGLLLAVGIQILLGMLGVAVGLSTIDVRSPDPLRGLRIGTSIWSLVASIVGLLVGAYVAARLGGAARRRDGLFAGLLTWATSMVLSVWLVSSGAGSILLGSGGIAPALSPVETVSQTELVGSTRWLDDVAQGVRVDDAARSAWLAFAGALASLLAALLGGGLGAVGSGLPPPRSDDLQSAERAREVDREDLSRQEMRG